MFETLTHSDFLKCENDDTKKMRFVKEVISDFQNSPDYKWAEKAKKYYDIENPEIEVVEKIIYDMKGLAHKDLVSPNSKIRNGYFPSIIDGHVSHLLANGITFENQSNKDKLGKNFDDVTKKIYRESLICGRGYGFYNAENKKTIMMPYLNTKPIVDDYTGSMTECIYYTQIASDKPKVFTLYEPDGFTQYVEEDDKPMQIKQTKIPYRYTKIENKVEGNYFIAAESQDSRLPIVQMRSKSNKSMLVGALDKLVALDLMSSQLVNNVSQSELIYWVLKNYGGMDDITDANFIINLIKSHVIHVGDDGSAEPHQIQVPFEANNTAFLRLKSELYICMHGVEHDVIRAGNPTATELESAYTEQRHFSANSESQVFDYVRGIMRLAGVDDDETFSVEYNETINTSEAITNLLASAPYLVGETGEAVTRKLASLNGMADQTEEILKDRQAAIAAQLGMQDNAQGGSEGLEV